LAGCALTVSTRNYFLAEKWGITDNGVKIAELVVGPDDVGDGFRAKNPATAK